MNFVGQHSSPTYNEDIIYLDSVSHSTWMGFEWLSDAESWDNDKLDASDFADRFPGSVTTTGKYRNLPACCFETMPDLNSLDAVNNLQRKQVKAIEFL